MALRTSCDECGFTSEDYHLVKNHSCYVTRQGGRCEDYPCCGHESGDCNGQKYGSDEAIKAQYIRELQAEDAGFFYDEDEEDW